MSMIAFRKLEVYQMRCEICEFNKIAWKIMQKTNYYQDIVARLINFHVAGSHKIAAWFIFMFNAHVRQT